MTADLNKLTVVELRAELKKHGLPQAGKKADLVERLSSAVENSSSKVSNEDPANDEPPAEAQVQPTVPTPSPDPATAASTAPVVAQEEQVLVPPESVDVTVLAEVKAPVSTIDGTPSGNVDAPPQDKPIATMTIDVPEENASSQAVPPITEVINDVKNRKRRSRSPSIDESIPKRLRPDDPEPRIVEPGANDGLPAPDDSAAPVDEAGTAEAKSEHLQPAYTPVEPLATLPGEAERSGTDNVDDIAIEEKHDDNSGYNSHHQDGVHDYPAERVQGDEPAETDYITDDRPVMPAIHPATSALYIRNLMRPLRPVDVKEYLIALATPPSQEPDPDVIVEFFLDHIRTHAFVSFNSIAAASRVRSALHDQVWPDERNRKALWVDFIPVDKVPEWINLEEGEGGGRGRMNRWEVVYEADADGNMTARLEEGGADTARPNPRQVAPPTGPASTFIPTGPSQAAGGIQGAPTGPRGRGGRMPPGYPLQGGVTSQEGVRATRALPSLLYRPQPEEVVRRRIDNMRSYYTKDRYRDMGPVADINRYTFENVDSFVDRGKEVFVGIRPPHRERQMRAAGAGRAPSGPRRGGPPPPSFRPRGDRYIGGGSGGGDSFGPRSRLDGAPLPTYGGPTGRQARFGR